MRLARLMLVPLAACSPRTPEPSVELLVGTWAHIVPLPGCHERRPDQWVREANDYVKQEGTDCTETYCSDGTWINPHRVLSGVPPRWTLIAQGTGSITVAIDAPLANGGRMMRNFVFESPDLMCEVDGIYIGMKLARVRTTAQASFHALAPPPRR